MPKLYIGNKNYSSWSMRPDSDTVATSAGLARDITGWLRAWRGGDAASGERLIEAR